MVFEVSGTAIVTFSHRCIPEIAKSINLCYIIKFLFRPDGKGNMSLPQPVALAQCLRGTECQKVLSIEYPTLKERK